MHRFGRSDHRLPQTLSPPVAAVNYFFSRCISIKLRDYKLGQIPQIHKQ